MARFYTYIYINVCVCSRSLTELVVLSRRFIKERLCLVSLKALDRRYRWTAIDVFTLQKINRITEKMFTAPIAVLFPIHGRNQRKREQISVNKMNECIFTRCFSSYSNEHCYFYNKRYEKYISIFDFLNGKIEENQSSLLMTSVKIVRARRK